MWPNQYSRAQWERGLNELASNTLGHIWCVCPMDCEPSCLVLYYKEISQKRSSSWMVAVWERNVHKTAGSPLDAQGTGLDTVIIP